MVNAGLSASKHMDGGGGESRRKDGRSSASEEINISKSAFPLKTQEGHSRYVTYSSP